MKKKSFLLIIILLFTFLTLAMVRSIISNSMSTSGTELGKTGDELSSLKIENDLLREKLFALSSLTLISSKAAEVGFVEEKKTFSLTNAVPIALKQ